MSIHIYENGTEGAQDGTEVQFLQFDGGVMADGAIKDVIKNFYIRTDGEEIEDICYTVALIDETNPANGITDKSFFRLINAINSGTYLDRTTNKYTAYLRKLDGNNTLITVKATIMQVNGVSDTQGKIYFWEITDAVEVNNNA